MYVQLNSTKNRYNYSNTNSVKYLCVFVIAILVFLLSYTYTVNNIREQKKLNIELDGVYRKNKLIYLWNTFFGDQTYEFGLGEDPFRIHNCSVQECTIVYNQDRSDVENYDAVVFHGPEYHPSQPKDFPAKRSPFQRYVYFSMESPLTRPVTSKLDNFFNWTMTYRLDSEVLVIYFAFYDIVTNQMVSHTNAPQWVEKTVNAESLKKREPSLKIKKKPVAWFVSNCHSSNKRDVVVKDLQAHIDVDVYGKCGKLMCSRDDSASCNKMLKSDYYFYLSFENSNCEDYVTEKLTTAYLNDVVPIFYGGANLTKFLPPHSFIDAREMSAKDLADKMNYLISHPAEYLEYFWWKDFYRLDTRDVANYKPFCKLCELLHDESLPVKTYGKIVEWWNTFDGHSACSKNS